MVSGTTEALTARSPIRSATLREFCAVVRRIVRHSQDPPQSVGGRGLRSNSLALPPPPDRLRLLRGSGRPKSPVHARTGARTRTENLPRGECVSAHPNNPAGGVGEGSKRGSSSGDPSPTPAAGARAPIAQELPSLDGVGSGGANRIDTPFRVNPSRQRISDRRSPDRVGASRGWHAGASASRR